MVGIWILSSRTSWRLKEISHPRIIKLLLKIEEAAAAEDEQKATHSWSFSLLHGAGACWHIVVGRPTRLWQMLDCVGAHGIPMAREIVAQLEALPLVLLPLPLEALDKSMDVDGDEDVEGDDAVFMTFRL